LRSPECGIVNNRSVIKMLPTPLAHRKRRKEARPGELLDAALALFVQKGYAATRVEEVARAAGVSKGTLFIYFPSKEELFKAVVRENISGRLASWQAEFEHFEGSTPDMVRYALQQWWLLLGATGASGISKLVMTEACHFPEIAHFYRQEVIEPGFALIRQILQRGVARGEFEPIDLEYGVYGLVAPMIFLIMWKHGLSTCAQPISAIDPDLFVARQTELLLSGLVRRPKNPNASNPVQ
jgi:TetR/AcrR family transcriptional regulator